VQAQAIDTTYDKFMVLEATISSSTCAVAIAPNGTRSNLVVQLPSLNTTALTNGLFSPVTKLELNLQGQLTDALCASNSSGPNAASQLLFDTAMAAISPRTGLLRNTAPERPAQNVFVQIGLIDAAGSFVPLDLNQPQALNQALNPKSSASEPRPNLTLGVRYVAVQTTLTQNTNFNANSPGSADVSAGNIAVFLPFMLKLN
jgi:hypothetical protein